MKHPALWGPISVSTNKPEGLPESFSRVWNSRRVAHEPRQKRSAARTHDMEELLRPLFDLSSASMNIRRASVAGGHGWMDTPTSSSTLVGSSPPLHHRTLICSSLSRRHPDDRSPWVSLHPDQCESGTRRQLTDEDPSALTGIALMAVTTSALRSSPRNDVHLHGCYHNALLAMFLNSDIQAFSIPLLPFCCCVTSS